MLAAEGEPGVARYVGRQVDLARVAAERIAREPGFEVAVAPESNIVCFRMAGEDAMQLELRRALLAKGDHYVSTTRFRGRQWLRLALMNPATELGDVERLLGELRRLANARGAP